MVAATPYVYTSETYNTTNIKVTVFQIDYLIIMRANVTNQGGTALDKVVLNLTDSNSVKKYTDQAMTDTTNTCPGPATCDIYEKNYTLLVADPTGTWIINVTANDTNSDTDSNSTTFTVQVGDLEVNLTTPDPGVYDDSNPLEKYQYTTFTVNANVTCRNYNCGLVYGTVRYNASSVNPDTAINVTEGATPFYIINQTSYKTWTESVCSCTVSGDTSCNDGAECSYHAYCNLHTCTKDACSARIHATGSNSGCGCSASGCYCLVEIEPPKTCLGVAACDPTGTCSYTCDSGWSNCDGDNSNGCETEGDCSLINCSSMSDGDTCSIDWTVNATGTIDTPYKIGVKFNSSFASVTDNHTDNATVQIAGGDLEVSLTYPPTSSTTNVDQNSTFNVNATVTCKDAACGYVYGTVRYNASSTYPDTGINTTEGATPLYIHTDSGNKWHLSNYSFVNNSITTEGIISTDNYTLWLNTSKRWDDVIIDSNGNQIINFSLEIPSSVSQINLSYALARSSPTTSWDWATYNISIYNHTSSKWTSKYNTTITFSTAYYECIVSDFILNISDDFKDGNTINISLNMTEHDKDPANAPSSVVSYTCNGETFSPVSPMWSEAFVWSRIYFKHKSTQSCGSLSKDQSCQLNWTVNATGTPIVEYKIGVLFNSSYSTVTDNHTDNATIKILECTEAFTIKWGSIQFGNLNPNTTQNNASGNNNETYNISNTGTCTLKVWIKGTDLTNTTPLSPSITIHTIGVGNLTWENATDDPSNAYTMTKNYVTLNSSFYSSIKNITTYYWLTVPPMPAGGYNGSITYCANTTQQSGESGSC